MCGLASWRGLTEIHWMTWCWGQWGDPDDSLRTIQEQAWISLCASTWKLCCLAHYIQMFYTLQKELVYSSTSMLFLDRISKKTHPTVTSFDFRESFFKSICLVREKGQSLWAEVYQERPGNGIELAQLQDLAQSLANYRPCTNYWAPSLQCLHEMRLLKELQIVSRICLA